MSLQLTVQSAVKAAFDAAGDLVEVVSYTKIDTQQRYDFTTSTLVPSAGEDTVLSVRSVWEPYSGQETLPDSLKKDAEAGDQIVTVPGSEVTVSPTTEDVINRPKTSTKWRVKGWLVDPAQGAYQFLCSKVS